MITSSLMALGLGDHFVELGLAFRTQRGLVEVEQRVGGDGDLVTRRLGRRCGSRGSLGDHRLADFLREQILVALAAGRILGRSGRCPEAGPPAKAGAAHHDFTALVDHVDALTSGLGLRRASGREKADRGQQGGNDFRFQDVPPRLIDLCWVRMRVQRCDFCAVGRFKHTNLNGFNHRFGIVSHLCNECPMAALVRWRTAAPHRGWASRHAGRIAAFASRCSHPRILTGLRRRSLPHHRRRPAHSVRRQVAGAVGRIRNEEAVMLSTSLESSRSRFSGEAREVVVFSGAGLSADSGIPTFRDGATGLWNNVDPDEVASIEGFLRKPRVVWNWLLQLKRLVDERQPNAGHQALARLQEICRAKQLTVITQNIDGYHSRAGNAPVLGSSRHHTPPPLPAALRLLGRLGAKRRRTFSLPPLRCAGAPGSGVVRRNARRGGLCGCRNVQHDRRSVLLCWHLVHRPTGRAAAGVGQTGRGDGGGGQPAPDIAFSPRGLLDPQRRFGVLHCSECETRSTAGVKRPITPKHLRCGDDVGDAD
jgi:hypothetical protein